MAYPEFVSLTVEGGTMANVSITQHTNPAQVLSRHRRGRELPVLCYLGLLQHHPRSVAAEWYILCQRDRLPVQAAPEQNILLVSSGMMLLVVLYRWRLEDRLWVGKSEEFERFGIPM